MKVRITKDGVTDHGSILEIDTVVEIDDKNGASLIAGAYADIVEDVEDADPTADEMAKAIDKKYSAADLKVAATAAGVQFDPAANKGTVVTAVIAAGKYADLMA